MATIPHREFPTQNNEIFDRIKNGETISVTENGRVVATLIPPPRTPFEQLPRSGGIRPAAPEELDFRTLPRTSMEETTAHLLTDSRGEG